MMSRQSKVMAEIKDETSLRYKNKSPQERIQAAIYHNKMIKEICFAGLKSLGFSKDEIKKIYQGSIHE